MRWTNGSYVENSLCPPFVLDVFRELQTENYHCLLRHGLHTLRANGDERDETRLTIANDSRRKSRVFRIKCIEDVCLRTCIWIGTNVLRLSDIV